MRDDAKGYPAQVPIFGEITSDVGGYRRLRTGGGALPAALSSHDGKGTAELSAGETIDGKYRILRCIGRGGMGTVYAALHLMLNETVAIKVLHTAIIPVPGMIMRFLREARVACKIKSEHVARVYDVGALSSGAPFIVMEYLEGIDLAEFRRVMGTLPVAMAVGYIIDACDAIGEAHRLGIVHRDLKPSNLFLAERREGERILKVLDFGLSKMYGTGEDSTQTGVTIGSPRYMAPEQMRSLRRATGSTDIWALGAILYELLSGRLPFAAQTIGQLCMLVLQAEPPALRSVRPDVPPELEAVVARCLRKAPEERFGTADDLSRALAPFCLPDPCEPIARRSGGASTLTLRAAPLALMTSVVELPVDPRPGAESPPTGVPAAPRSKRAGRALLAIGAVLTTAVAAVTLSPAREHERLASPRAGAVMDDVVAASASSPAPMVLDRTVPAAPAALDARTPATPGAAGQAQAPGNAPAVFAPQTPAKPAAAGRVRGKRPTRVRGRPVPLRDPFGGSRN